MSNQAPERTSPKLFEVWERSPASTTCAPTGDRTAPGLAHNPLPGRAVVATVGPRTIDLFERARNLDDEMELRDLFVGRVESELGPQARRPHLAAEWRESRRRRSVSPEEVLDLPVTPRLVKELFNFFFRDDLYGTLRDEDTAILSSGAADEGEFGLPQSLKDCVAYAMDRDWYGYSDSRGRIPTRMAIARLENVHVPGAHYTDQSISVTMGTTFAMNAVADFVFRRRPAEPALVLAPNYPPLVATIGRRAPTRIIPTSSGGAATDIAPLIAALRPDTPMVMLQTVTNPTGVAVDEADLERLIAAASPSTMIVLDEAHECFGPSRRRSSLRAAPNVVRLVSLSKSLSTPGLKLGWIASSPEFGREFYEYASSSYGGPPSVFALLVEVATLFQRWRLEGVTEVSHEELGELDVNSGVRLNGLQRAYASFVDEMERRDDGIIESRTWISDALAEHGFESVPAPYSLNVATLVPGIDDPYVFFRQAMDHANTAVYPGTLNFLFDDRCVRITTARPMSVLSAGVERLAGAFGTQRPDGCDV